MSTITNLLKVKYFISLAILLGLFSLWTYKGIFETGIHVDLARDLHFLSDLWIGRIVWLGPMTSANFPASPIYYYLLFPGLLISRGDGLSIIFSHTFFAVSALGLFAYFKLKQAFFPTLLVVLTIGLSPWWISTSSFPWNGHMYASWVLIALVSLWLKFPFFISALLFGISLAINPAAILAIPLLCYEWIVIQQRLKNLFYLLLGLSIPWIPIFTFEFITKGFLTRHWLEYPAAAGIVFDPKITNITPLLNTLGISQTSGIIIFVTAFLLGVRREKIWLIFSMLPLIFLMLVSPLRQYYLLGLASALTFTTVVILSSRKVGQILLILFILSYVQAINLPAPISTDRSIQKMSLLMDIFLQRNNLDKTKKYAVVSVRDLQNSTPQADDFRFFLRTKGINVLNIDEYPQADILLLFIEVPNFGWQNYDNWHIQRFGGKKFISNQNINGTEIIMYGRK